AGAARQTLVRTRLDGQHGLLGALRALSAAVEPARSARDVRAGGPTARIRAADRGAAGRTGRIRSAAAGRGPADRTGGALAPPRRRRRRARRPVDRPGTARGGKAQAAGGGELARTCAR